ncbi:hypothetical protein HPB47_016319, partial [Ixodes persulcatus]
MTGSKDVCGSCSAQFFGRQQFLHCSGICGLRFHCKCINVAAEDYDLLMKNGTSSYKCSSCTRRKGVDNVPSTDDSPCVALLRSRFRQRSSCRTFVYGMRNLHQRSSKTWPVYLAPNPKRGHLSPTVGRQLTRIDIRLFVANKKRKSLRGPERRAGSALYLAHRGSVPSSFQDCPLQQRHPTF